MHINIMNRKVSRVFISNLIIVITLLSMVSCGINHVNKGTPIIMKTNKKLNTQESNLLNKWLKTLPECHFIGLSKKKISPKKITDCIDAFDTNFHTDKRISFTLRNKVQKQFLDYYLGSKLLPSLVQLSKQDLSKVFSHIINSTYAANPKVIKWFLEKGLPTNNYGYITASSKKETCETSLLLLNRSLQSNNYSKSQANSLKKTLFYMLANYPTNAHCPKVIESLIKEDQSLLNAQVDTGETPLHFFVESIRDGTYKSVYLTKKLITNKNINKKDKYGRTPLDILLTKSPYPLSKAASDVIKILRQFGARQNLAR